MFILKQYLVNLEFRYSTCQAQYLDALGEFGGVSCVSLALCGVLSV